MSFWFGNQGTIENGFYHPNVGVPTKEISKKSKALNTRPISDIYLYVPLKNSIERNLMRYVIVWTPKLKKIS